MEDAGNYPNRIRSLRLARGLSLEALGDMVGTTKTQIRRLEVGDRRLTTDWMRRLAGALGVRSSDLLDGADDMGTVPVVGHVGAGAEIHKIEGDSSTERLDEAERPPGADEHTVAVIVHGDSMAPVFPDRSVIYYRNVPGPPEQVINQECVVRLADGRTFIKILRRGSEPGLYDLFSYNAPLMPDVVVEWAVRVRWVDRGA